MPLHIKTDEEFDRALDWLAKIEQRTKSDVVRDAVLGRYQSRKRGFEFGALARLNTKRDRSRSIVAELKRIDVDDELD